MTTVGIRELKAHLSHYVRRARQGERVIVTDRGREVAELRAITPAHPGLKELIDAGVVKWSGGKPTEFPRPIEIRGKPISDTVLELRDDPLR
jgi:antitoxin (DNA-binding transcriptional repressor) of toxin-antitoxin stability system